MTSCDLDLDPITFIYDRDLILKMHLGVKINFLSQAFQKLQQYTPAN